jgi:hypothetical protein
MDLAAELPGLPEADQRDLAPWTLSLLDPAHPLQQTSPQTARGHELSMLATWARRVRDTVSVTAYASQNCPQPDLGDLPGLDLTRCRVAINNTVVVSWKKNGGPANKDALVQKALQDATGAFAYLLELFDARPDDFVSRHGLHSMYLDLDFSVGFDNVHVDGGQADDGWILGDGHRADLRVSMNRFHPSNLAHEMVHGFQFLLREGAFDQWIPTDKWIIEGIARWAAKDYLQARITTIDGLVEMYHERMRMFWGDLDEGVPAGMLSMKHVAHSYFHDYAQHRGRGALKAVISIFESTGSSEAVIERLNLPETWHDFSRQLLRHDPWNRISDSPEDFGDPLGSGLMLVHPETLVFETGPSFSLTEDVSLPKVSATKAFIRVDPTVPFVQIRLEPGLSEDGLEMSAFLVDGDIGLPLGVAQTEIICFDAGDPSCAQETIHPRTDRIWLVISNADSTASRSPTLTVATLPIQLTGRQIIVGQSRSLLKGTLKLIRTANDKIKLEAEELWFEFEDELYDRLIPDEVDTGSATGASVSKSLIRNYVRRHAQFRGFVELEYEIDDEVDPVEEDGVTWVTLRTRRSDEGNFFATPHKFFLRFDAGWFRALGGALGIGGVVFQRALVDFNQTAFPQGSFADTVQAWFTQAMTLGTERGADGAPRYTVDPGTGELRLRMGNVTVSFLPE